MTDRSAPAPVDQLVDELCNPHTHIAAIRDWDTNRNAKTRFHRTTQPGLLEQVGELMFAAGGNDTAASGSAHESAPPARWDAISTHTTITLEVARWCWHLEADQRSTVEDNLRQLLGVMSNLDNDQTTALTTDVRRWHRACQIVAGWDMPPTDPRAPCPAVIPRKGQTPVVCGARTLRINISERQAFCGSCGTEWNAGELEDLGEHVRAYRDRSDTAAAAARSRHRATKEAGRLSA